MRAWERSPLSQACGRCSETIPRGEAVLVLRCADRAHGWVKYRCHNCAEETAPEDLPPLPEPQVSMELQPAAVRGIGVDRFDHKMAAAGKD